MKLSATPSRVACRSRRPLRLWRRAGAFTIVELLVVIGIIAILITLLMPALSSARERANAIKCQAQQRQLVQALVLHANSREGYMPLSGLPDDAMMDPVSLGDPRRVKYAYYQTTDGGYHLMSMLGALAPMLGQAVRDDSLAHVEEDLQRGVIREVFTCPSDVEGGRLGNTVFEGGQTYLSFAFNDSVFAANSGGEWRTGRYMPPCLRGKLSRIPRPAETFLFTDAKPRSDGSWMLYCAGESNVTLRDAMVTTMGPANNPHASNSPTTKLAFTWDLIDYKRHRGYMDVAFADGHCEHVPITEGALSKISMNGDFPSN